MIRLSPRGRLHDSADATRWLGGGGLVLGNSLLGGLAGTARVFGRFDFANNGFADSDRLRLADAAFRAFGRLVDLLVTVLG